MLLLVSIRRLGPSDRAADHFLEHVEMADRTTSHRQMTTRR
jgi:hypothetical protein